MSPKPLALACAFASAAALAAGLARSAAADGMVGPSTEETGQVAQTETTEPGAPQAPSLSAKIVEPGAGKDTAKVQVSVKGVDSPLLQYKVDDGPAFETSDTSVRVRGLKPGQHKISVLLEGKDGAPLGPSETLDVNVP